MGKQGAFGQAGERCIRQPGRSSVERSLDGKPVTTEGNVKSVEVTKDETSTCHMSHGENQTINKGLREFFSNISFTIKCSVSP
jgi:hypothetical protein